MEVSVFKVKKYNSVYEHVICVNGRPICIAKSSARAGLIASCIMGNSTEQIKDGYILKCIEKAKEIVNG